VENHDCAAIWCAARNFILRYCGHCRECGGKNGQRRLKIVGFDERRFGNIVRGLRPTQVSPTLLAVADEVIE
jgi:hypothetical protein